MAGNKSPSCGRRSGTCRRTCRYGLPRGSRKMVQEVSWKEISSARLGPPPDSRFGYGLGGQKKKGRSCERPRFLDTKTPLFGGRRSFQRRHGLLRRRFRLDRLVTLGGDMAKTGDGA